MKAVYSTSAVCLLLLSFTGCPKPKPSGETGSSARPPQVNSSADVVRLGGFGGGLSGPGSGSIEIPIRIDDGYHINANPATFSYLIATEVTAEKVEGLDVGKPIYPPAVKKKFQFADEPLAVYEGNVNVKLPFAAKSSGTKSLPLSVRVQACDQEKCFPPDTLHATIAVEVK
jgi:hypothetical protein